MSEKDASRLLKYQDVADRLGCCTKHVRECYVNTGKLAAVRLGKRAVRFRDQDVTALVEALMAPQAVGL